MVCSTGTCHGHVPGHSVMDSQVPLVPVSDPRKAPLPLVSFAPERQPGLTLGFSPLLPVTNVPSAWDILVSPLMSSEPQRLSPCG